MAARERNFRHIKTIISDCQVIKKCITKAFANVEELLIFCMESEHGRNTVQRIVRQFLVEPELLKISLINAEQRVLGHQVVLSQTRHHAGRHRDE